MTLLNICKCTKCQLCDSEVNKELGIPLGWGPGKKIMIVGLAPSDFRNGTKYAMKPVSNGDTAKILIDEINKFDELKDSFYITNIVKCSFPKNILDTSVLEICYNEWFVKELISISPKKIICLGKEVFEFLSSKAYVKYVFDLRQVWHHAYIARQRTNADTWSKQWKKALSD